MTIVALLFTRWEFYLSIFVIVFVWRLVMWLSNPLRNIPGPRGYPIIGSSLDYSLSNDMQKLYLEREKQYGTIYKDYTLFGGTIVHISDPNLATWVLVTNSTNYDRQKSLARLIPGLEQSIFGAKGKAHAVMKKHLNPMFTLGSVKEFLPIFNGKAKELVKYIEDKINEDGKGFIEMEMLQKLSDLTLDVIAACAFGYDFNCVLGGRSEEGRATNTILTASFNLVRKSFEELLPFLKIIPSKERDEVKKAEEIFYGLIETVIATRKQEMESHPGEAMKKPDLLQKLISLYEEAGLSISNIDLFHQVFAFMIAGHETTSVSMTWVIFMLAKYPQYLPKLKSEVEEAFDGGSEITFDAIDKLRFLDNFIKETMRLHSVVLFVGRQARSADKIGPYTIPSGTRVFVHITSLCRNPRYWKNPDTFDPDRFDKEGDHDPMFPYYYFPFSRGPRMCIGYRFAQMEMKVVLAHLVKNFTFKLAKSQSPDIEGRNFLTYRPCPVPLIEVRQ